MKQLLLVLGGIGVALGLVFLMAGFSMIENPPYRDRSQATTLSELAEIELERHASQAAFRNSTMRAQPYQSMGFGFLVVGAVAGIAGLVVSDTKVGG